MSESKRTKTKTKQKREIHQISSTFSLQTPNPFSSFLLSTFHLFQLSLDLTISPSSSFHSLKLDDRAIPIHFSSHGLPTQSPSPVPLPAIHSIYLFDPAHLLSTSHPFSQVIRLSLLFLSPSLLSLVFRSLYYSSLSYLLPLSPPFTNPTPNRLFLLLVLFFFVFSYLILSFLFSFRSFLHANLQTLSNINPFESFPLDSHQLYSQSSSGFDSSIIVPPSLPLERPPSS